MYVKVGRNWQYCTATQTSQDGYITTISHDLALFLCHRKYFDTILFIWKQLCNSYTMACPPVCGDNPQALASGLSLQEKLPFE